MDIDSINYLNRLGNYSASSTFYVALFIESGTCSYKVDGTKYDLEKGHVLFIPKGLERRCEASSVEPHTKYAVRFTWNDADLKTDFPDIETQVMHFKPLALFPFLKQRFEELVPFWDKKDRYYYPLCRGLFLEIIARIHLNQFEQQHSGKQSTVVKQVRDYILEYYREPLSIEELAHLVKRNSSHLITSFKKHFGVSPLEYMHRVRISKAEEYLLNTDSSMEWISRELGYCDAPYFNRMFKKITGITPSTYRKQL